MASKRIDVPGIGPVSFIKSARSRSLRLSVTPAGVRVSLPRWTPYAAAVLFARNHADWVAEERQKVTMPALKDGDKIGKLHTLQFLLVPERSETRTKVTPTKLVIPYRPSENPADLAVQARAEQAARRALKKEAAVLLSPRLKSLAERHGMTYQTVTIKHLKRRWGSCDNHGHITLNLFLMQLSWQQIDYVICHELAHTKHMNHSAKFWQEVERMLPDARMIARRVRHIQPALVPKPTPNPLDD